MERNGITRSETADTSNITKRKIKGGKEEAQEFRGCKL